MAFGDDVAQHGWRTGSVIAAEMLPLLQPYLIRHDQQPALVAADDWLVVVSQTCDIVVSKLDAEPLVEVLLCKPILGKPRKGRRNLESTRHLDFRPNRETHADLVLTAHAVADRYLIPRNLLSTNVPDQARCLDNISSSRVLAWYALRAGRPSWPNNFCDRIRNATDALKDALDLDLFAEDNSEVRVAIAEKNQELRDGEAYHLAVYFVVDEDTWNGDLDDRKAINAAFAKFVSELDACEGIEVNQDLSGVVPGNEFSWQETQQTDQWNFANLSHRD
ncbi:hypothetical protein RO575_08230 [Methylomonas sp. MO1]|uniref:hypothetical protein n=1 Tax=Methylomonas sp. MO1 TaxID=3073619 RepID=UPI0028A5019A|nr:hypothetical protein [Methylomonas sp. MO1]MDT4289543.1 hypothetical protein [Methylomonas sp. MO1]